VFWSGPFDANRLRRCWCLSSLSTIWPNLCRMTMLYSILKMHKPIILPRSGFRLVLRLLLRPSYFSVSFLHFHKANMLPMEIRLIITLDKARVYAHMRNLWNGRKPELGTARLPQTLDDNSPMPCQSYLSLQQHERKSSVDPAFHNKLEHVM
jgi:hypothetical protein